MKRFVTVIFSLIILSQAIAQNNEVEFIKMNNGPINIGLDKTEKGFVPPINNSLKSGNTPKSNIVVNYLDMPVNAKQAFEYAISLWEQIISSDVTINVTAKWEAMEGNTLAYCSPTTFYRNFSSAPVLDVYYPVALAEKLSGKDLNDEKEADISCSFNKNISWYFGTNGNTPSNKYDFVSAVLHEMAHGLGFSGFLTVENGVGTIKNGTKSPSIFDYVIINKNNQRITDNTVFGCPSNELKNQLTSENLNLNFVENNTNPNIYAPSTWRSGSSIYHLKDSQPELMSAYLCKGRAIHNPGENTINTLAEIGWNTITLKADELKDVETISDKIFVYTTGSNVNPTVIKSFEIIYSTDNYTTQKVAQLTYNSSVKQYEGTLQTDGFKGKVRYYYKAVTVSGKEISQPTSAPDRTLSFKIGEDYYPPVLSHNPVESVSSEIPAMEFFATATDNVGINSVTVEYKINGIEYEPFELDANDADLYSGKLSFPMAIFKNDVVEYRIVAEDNSIRKNKKYSPAKDYYQVNVVGDNNTTTSTDEIFVETDVKMYPNPCSNILFIDCAEMVNSASVEISITNLYGKTVHREIRNDMQFNSKVSVDVSKLSSGVYLASISDSETNSFTQKIIKN